MGLMCSVASAQMVLARSCGLRDCATAVLVLLVLVLVVVVELLRLVVRLLPLLLVVVRFCARAFPPGPVLLLLGLLPLLKLAARTAAAMESAS